jgi:4-amino-4-deoxy-L-arabinose transferase-like glycosyltransferase
MTKRIQSLWYLSALALFLAVGISLSAQNSAMPTQAPDAQAQQPAQPPTSDQPAPPPQAAPAQTPDQATQPAPGSQSPTAQPTDTQSFSGTIVKSGDKYMLQDEASGKTYDIDHQAEVQKFDGKRVKVKGTVDASGKMIHLQ